MAELEFHCPYCGEQNEQFYTLSSRYDELEVNTTCDYCKELLTLTVVVEFKVKSVD